jgi:3'-phosphoadenosine 5'-phosphosulfate sulfotransferase (PAPS reductase)/FAD synthetase
VSIADPYRIDGPALISFSGGRTSGYMLKHVLDVFDGVLPGNIKVAFANTGREMPETLDFVQECSERWGVFIQWLEYDPNSPYRTKLVSHNSASRNGEPFAAVIQNRKFLPNPVTRFCTIEMKIRRFREYCVNHLGWSHWNSIVGLRADEMHRVHKQRYRNTLGKDRWTTTMPLADAGVAKHDVAAWWSEQPFDLRLPNVCGSTPMGNCDLCFLKSAATIKGIMRQRPETAAWWIDAEAHASKLGKIRAPEMALFRADRPSYARLQEVSSTDLFDDDDQNDCACTD